MSHHSAKSALVTVLFGAFLFTGCTKNTEINLATVDDTMAFDRTVLEGKAGGTVKLHFKNNGTTPAMQHNFILAKPGTDNDVAMAGLSAGAAKDYVPDSPNVIAHTKLLKPGEDVTITFTAPAAGEYPFLCSFPGHYPMMKGTFKFQ